jgi:hypothetical protein
MMATKLTIIMEALPEDETPEQSEKRTGSAEGYAKAVRDMMKKAEGRWGWCCVRIKATLGERTGTAFLGDCSYQSAEDFFDNSGYFPQMLEEAVGELHR